MWSYLKKRQIHKLLLLLMVDIALILLAFYASYMIKFSVKTLHITLDIAFRRANVFLFLCILSHVLFLYLYGLYGMVRPQTPVRTFLLIGSAIVTSTGMLMVLEFFEPRYWIGRIVLTIQIPLSILLIAGWRAVFYNSSLSLVQRKRLALIGSGELIAGFLEEAKTPLQSLYRLHGICITRGCTPGAILQGDRIARYPTVGDLVQDTRVEVIAFQSLEPGLTDLDVQSILRRTCEGLEVSDLITLYKAVTGKVPLRYVDSQWLLSHVGIQGGPAPLYLKAKRIIDLLVAGSLFLLALPLFLILGLLIKLDSPGPVLFRQDRLGRHRKPFQCLKFRTMVEQAEEQSGPVWASPKDPRITRTGGWLRRSRLDELPQLINVIRGDMSLIGPRPIRAFFADRLAERIPLYELRFALRPGLTGWAQVNHPYADTEASQLEKFEYELFYIQNASMVIDFVILIKTLRTVFGRKGR